jgi:hypothetical protein
MNIRLQIDRFLENKTIAIAGVSRNPKKFGHYVYTTLRNKGYKVYAINPHANEIEGVHCFKSLAEVPEQVTSLLILSPAAETLPLLKEAVALAPRFQNVWIQNGNESPEILEIARSNNLALVTKACILMYADPSGFHKFHQQLSYLFGGYHKRQIADN